MAVKPSECDGVTREMVRRVDAAEASIDEALRASYEKGSSTPCPTGYALTPREKEMLAARYAANWTVEWDYSRASGETIAVFHEKEKTDENDEQATDCKAEGACEAIRDAEAGFAIGRADEGGGGSHAQRTKHPRKSRRRN